MSNTKNSIVLPDIFITGVMKGGTTILHDYICAHPLVCSGVQKEIHYFSLYYDQGPEWYAEHFKKVPEGCRTIDASPTYFDITNTAQIPKLIRAYTEDPRVILISRDPIERAISHFVHLKTINKMPALADIEPDEFFSQSIEDAYRERTPLGFALNQVLSFSLYSRKFITYQQILQSNQLLVIDNQTLRVDPRNTMRSVYEFLDLEYVDNDMFGVVKYSNRSGINQISLETFNHLADFLYPDYEHYCKLTKLDFKQAVHQEAIDRVA